MASLAAIRSWDYEVEIAVIGSGMAGTAAALGATDADPDADVLILEKMPEPLAGGSGRCSGQKLYAPGEEEIDNLKAYHRALNAPNPIPEDLLDTWAAAVTTQRPWLEDVADVAGMRFVRVEERTPDFPDFPGASSCKDIFTVEGRSGVWTALTKCLHARGIKILYETPVFDLIQDADTLEVHGVLARTGDKTLAIRASRGVILCTGGFAANSEMLMNYCGYERMAPLGAPGNSGDGILMLQRAGAQLWHMRNFGQVGGIFPAFKFPEFRCAFQREFIPASSWIDVGSDDARFYDETGAYFENHFKILVHGKWVDSPLPYVLPAHMIFDDVTRRAGPLAQEWAGWNMIALEHEWSADNRKEIEKGWIIAADTIPDLALKLNRDPRALDASVRRYNGFCESGRDEDFGRRADRLRPIVDGPFYAIELVPGIAGTSGGGVRNSRSQVLTPEGRPIPRLYEAGELGSTFANLYQAGSFLTEAIAFGRIAGGAAAAESARDFAGTGVSKKKKALEANLDRG